jgi:NAD(P) transhydrogenase
VQRLHKTLDHEVEVLQHQFMRNSVRSAHAAAVFKDANTVSLVSETGAHRDVRFDHALISVGTRPHRPAHVPFDDKRIFDSDEMLELDVLPRTLTVIGGGVIGVEYATIFSALDVPVTLIEARSTILDFVDREIVDDFMHQMRDRGITIRLGTAVKEITATPDYAQVTLADGRVIRSSIVLYAAGRTGNVGSLGLDTVGIESDDRGRIKVDAQTFQTTLRHIYATGDVIGFPSLASTSMEQGRVAACHAFGVALPPPPETFPYGIYAVPEISTVGQSEEEARASGISYEVGMARFRETSRGHIMGVDSGFLKLIFALDSRRLLGAHIVGEGATELIHIGQAVINLGGTVDFFVNNTFNYPTLAEAYKIAGLDAWNRMGRG